MQVHVNSFVRRQTSDSRFAHFNGTWDELVEMVEGCWHSQRPGYRDGVVLVRVPARRFMTSIVELKEGDRLVGRFEPRRTGETPRMVIGIESREKTPALMAEIVLYTSSVLSEDNDNELPPEEGNWEIISINASPGDEEEPINPTVLMHNHFGSDGGTATGLSDEKFVSMLKESFEFWRNKAMCV